MFTYGFSSCPTLFSAFAAFPEFWNSRAHIFPLVFAFYLRLLDACLELLDISVESTVVFVFTGSSIAVCFLDSSIQHFFSLFFSKLLCADMCEVKSKEEENWKLYNLGILLIWSWFFDDAMNETIRTWVEWISFQPITFFWLPACAVKHPLIHFPQNSPDFLFLAQRRV